MNEVIAETMCGRFYRIEDGAIIAVLMERLGVTHISITRQELQALVVKEVLRKDDIETGDVVFHVVKWGSRDASFSEQTT